MASPPLPPPAQPPEKPFRWSILFRGTTEPLFVLNSRQRILHVNSAWEALTGFSLAEVRGQPCRRRTQDAADRGAALLSALAPPAAVKQGRPVEIRRRLPVAGGPLWALVQFFPLKNGRGETPLLGKICPLAASETILQSPLPEKLLALHDQATRDHGLEHLPADTIALARLHEQIDLARQSKTPVSIVGPPGAGKQWLARCLHHATHGLGRFFASLDCVRLPPEAIATVILEPDSKRMPLGTLYLQTPNYLPHDLQARLCNWLDREDTETTPRLVAGFVHDPAALVRGGTLLPRLYGQLTALTLMVPSLVERTEDWPWLIQVFLARAAKVRDQPAPALTPEARQILAAHSWPGNLAELYRVLRGAVHRAKGRAIEPNDLPAYLRQLPTPPPASLPLDALLEQVERKLLALALRLTKNKKNRAAELLAIWRPRLLRRLAALQPEEP